MMTLLGVEAFAIASVPWTGVLSWPLQLWHFLLAVGVLVLGLLSAPETKRVMAIGAAGGCCFYARLWHTLLSRGAGAELLWYALYIGLHTGGLMAGIYSCSQGRLIVGRMQIGLIACSLAINVAYAASFPGAAVFPLPPLAIPP